MRAQFSGPRITASEQPLNLHPVLLRGTYVPGCNQAPRPPEQRQSHPLQSLPLQKPHVHSQRLSPQCRRLDHPHSRDVKSSACRAFRAWRQKRPACGLVTLLILHLAYGREVWTMNLRTSAFTSNLKIRSSLAQFNCLHPPIPLQCITTDCFSLDGIRIDRQHSIFLYL